MGTLKTRKVSKGALGASLIKKAAKGAKGLLGAVSGKRGGTGRRRSRLTPEKLAKKILVERLKKKLYKLKYGGR